MTQHKLGKTIMGLARQTALVADNGPENLHLHAGHLTHDRERSHDRKKPHDRERGLKRSISSLFTAKASSNQKKATRSHSTAYSGRVLSLFAFDGG